MRRAAAWQPSAVPVLPSPARRNTHQFSSHHLPSFVFVALACAVLCVAGVAGMAVGLLSWAHQQLGTTLGALKSWPTTQAMVDQVKALLDQAVPKSAKKQPPSVLVLGALGRCGMLPAAVSSPSL
jgi:hypothetical protein